VKETKEGVVKEPCSLATGKASSQITGAKQAIDDCIGAADWKTKRTDLDIVTVVVGNARVGGTWKLC
jgi:hypothetical protein